MITERQRMLPHSERHIGERENALPDAIFRDRPDSGSGQKSAHHVQTLINTPTTATDAKVVVGDVRKQVRTVDRCRQQQHTFLFHKSSAERFHTILTTIPRVGDTATIRCVPVEEIGKLTEERVESCEIGDHALTIVFENVFTRLEGDQRKTLARRRVADRQVVLAAIEPPEKVPIPRCDPADTQARQAIGLGHHVQGPNSARTCLRSLHEDPVHLRFRCSPARAIQTPRDRPRRPAQATPIASCFQRPRRSCDGVPQTPSARNAPRVRSRVAWSLAEYVVGRGHLAPDARL